MFRFFFFVRYGHSVRGEGQLKSGYIIITNNPLVAEKLGPDAPVVYRDISYQALLRDVRDRIHAGGRLLTHPLSGSVKPGETPYKSVMLFSGKEGVDKRSLEMIENAILACSKFEQKAERFRPEVYEDFRLIDWTLLESAIKSIHL